MNLLVLIFWFLSGQDPFSISSIFADKHYIPFNYTCSGLNISPEIRIKEIPKNTVSLALIVDDPDTAFGNFDHWVMWNIPVQAKIRKNSAPGVVGRNSRKENKYTGPCPPSGVHEYHFKMFALDKKLDLADTCGKQSLINAMKGHVISEARLIGFFNK